MPLMSKSVNSPMVAHCFKVISNVVKELNPQQPHVITADQPIYAAAKQVQWLLPDKYKNVVVMIGPLYIEMAFLNATGNWLEGNGWVTIFERAHMTIVGHIDSFLCGLKIKRSRFAHQVSLAALIKLTRQVFESQNKYLNCSDWKRHCCSQSATVSYWFTVTNLEVLLFMFIYSLREGDFPLFVPSLESIVLWMFSLNHIHYARWLPVFLEYLKKMSNESNPHPGTVFQC